MPTDFIWHEDSTPSTPQPEASPPGGGFDKAARKVLLALGVLVLLVAGGVRVLYWQAEQGAARAKADLNAVMALEVQALARSDSELLARFQDSDDLEWSHLQADWARRKPQLRNLTIRNLTLHDNSAWVEVSWQAAGATQQSVEFYRRVASQWVHTRPDPAYWGKTHDRNFGAVTLTFTDADAALVERLGPELAREASQLCADLGCTFNLPTVIDLQPFYRPLQLEGEIVRVASPHLRALDDKGVPLTDWQTTLRAALVQMQVQRAMAEIAPVDLQEGVRRGLVLLEMRRHNLPLTLQTPNALAQQTADDLDVVNQRFGSQAIPLVLQTLRALSSPANPAPSDWRPYFQLRLLTEARWHGYSPLLARDAAPVVRDAQVTGDHAQVQLVFLQNGTPYLGVHFYHIVKGTWWLWEGAPADWGASYAETAQDVNLVYQEGDHWWATGLAPQIQQTLLRARQRLGIKDLLPATTIIVGLPASINRDRVVPDTVFVPSPLLREGVKLQSDRGELARFLARSALMTQQLDVLDTVPADALYRGGALDWALNLTADDPELRAERVQEAQATLANNAALSVGHLFLADHPSSSEDWRRRWVQMPLFFEYITQKWGDQAVTDLIQTRSQKPLDAWLAGTLHVTPETFESGWHEYIKSQ